MSAYVCIAILALLATIYSIVSRICATIENKMYYKAIMYSYRYTALLSGNISSGGQNEEKD